MRSELSVRASSYSRLMRLTTLVRIRWFAIVCQLGAILFVVLYLGFPLALVPCIIVVTLSACLNIFLTFHYSFNHRMTPVSATIVLAFDIILLSLLLFLTGGLQNPFAILLVAPAALCATSLNVPYIISLNLLVILLATMLAFFHLPLPWYPGQVFQAPRLWIDGIWAAIVSSLIFTTAYSYRVAEEARQLADALTATELILQQEQHLSVLDGLAAAAAHELGTPLATIQLVAKELQRQLEKDAGIKEDMDLLISQTQRCRDILQRLTSLASDGEEHLSHLKLTSALEEVIAPHRNFGIDIVTAQGDIVGDEPVIHRNPGILYGLGNLVENAVDFARKRVTVSYRWTDKQVLITVIDDGKGFPPNILDRIGEPYTTSREGNSHGGGLGLGLFIAKTLLERSGAYVQFRNSHEKNLGAEVTITWPRDQLI